MNEALFINMFLSFVLFLLGLLFLGDVWHSRGKFFGALDFDKIFFPVLKDRRILKKANQLAFVLCVIMSILTLLNGIISFIYPTVPNVSAVFIFVAIFLSWPSRIIFIIVNKNKKYQDVIAVWPFKNEKGR